LQALEKLFKDVKLSNRALRKQEFDSKLDEEKRSRLKNVELSGFQLEDVEKEMLLGIISKALEKAEKTCEIEYAKISMKKSVHGKTFLHEIKCSMKTRMGAFNAKESHYNMFRAVAGCLEKITNEIGHKTRIARQER